MPASAGERRTVSVLMVDVANSTVIGEQLGPERSKFLFDEVVRLMTAEVERFGGTVAQLSGDGLYALFGAPVAHDDDAERAVRAGLAIHEALGRYAIEMGEAYGIELAARVGINSGPVVLLPSDAPPEERYNALGDTVNVAARLQTHAGVGGVAIGPETARHVERTFELEPLGPLELKGKAEPMEAFRVHGEQTGAGRPRSSLVGRELELSALNEALSDLADGRGAIVALTGEAGIGKSRLVMEARERFDGRVRFLEMQGASFAQEIPYYPLRSLLRAWLSLGLDDPEARSRLELKAALAALLGERASVAYPFVGTLLGLTLEGEAADTVHTLTPDAVKLQTHRLVGELVGALARERPLCLAIEDLHFADESTLELVEELLGLAEETAILFLLLYRSDPDSASWDLGEHARRHHRHRFSELALEPLDADASAALAEDVAGAELPAELAQLLTERTGGNPFFLEEALTDLVERGELRRVNNHVELAVPEAELTLPGAVQEALQARLDRLSGDARELASVAAVVGRSFGLPLLERLVPRERLLPGLSDLQRLELVVEERRRPAPEYRFRHGLVRDAAYQGLLEEQRRELHLQVGEALETLATNDMAVSVGTLAEHFAAADDAERAARYLLEAGDAARGVGAEHEAIAVYRRALPFLDVVGDAERARSTLFRIALAHHLAFEFSAASAAWAEGFARPAAPLRLEPTERIVFGQKVRPEGDYWTPGYGYDWFSWWVQAHLFRGLLRPEGTVVVPDLATAVVVSDDGLTYKFDIDEAARWSDGEPVLAEDFASALLARRQDQLATTSHLLEPVVSAKALDQRTLELRLDAPRHLLPYILATPAALPWPGHRRAADPAGWRNSDSLVGNGPFVLAASGTERTAMRWSPLWHGPRGNLAEIEVQHARDRESTDDWKARTAAQLRAGELDLLDLKAGNLEAEELQRSGYGRTFDSQAGPVYLLLRPDRPPLDERRLRLALAHGVRRGDLVARDTGSSEGTGGLVPPEMPGHTPELALAQDAPRAGELLVESGLGDGGLPELVFQSILPDSIGQDLVAQLAAIGLRVRVANVPIEHIDDVPPTVHGTLGGYSADYPDPGGIFAALIRVTGLTDSRESELDRKTAELLDAAEAARSRDDRLAHFRALDRLLVSEQAIIVPLVYARGGLWSTPGVEGLQYNWLNQASLADVVVRRAD